MNKRVINQIIRFGLVGGTAFFIDYGILIIMVSIFKINYLIANCISFSVSVVINYILNDLFVFKMEKGRKSFQVFLIISILGLGINQIIMWIMVDKIYIYYILSKIVATFIVMCWNFIMRKMLLEVKM